MKKKDSKELTKIVVRSRRIMLGFINRDQVISNTLTDIESEKSRKRRYEKRS